MMNRPQRHEYNRRLLTSLQKITLQEYRIAQWEKYVLFVKRTLGIDIKKNPELDPFKKVTGFEAKDFLVDKWLPYYPNKGILSCPTTDFLSTEHLLSMKRVGDDLWEDYSCLEEFDTYVDYRPLGKRIVDHRWHFNYGAISYYLPQYSDSEERPAVHKGVFFIQPEPLGYISQTSEFPIIYKMLREIATWMTHDMTGHMSIDLFRNLNAPEARCYQSLENNQLIPWEIFYGGEIPLDLEKMSFTADEQRRYSLHLDLAKMFYQCNPLLKTNIKLHMSGFWELLIQSLGIHSVFDDSSERGRRIAVARYFMKIYLFCVMRIVPYNDLISWIKELGIEDIAHEFWRANKFENNLLALYSEGNSGAPYNKMGPEASRELWVEKNIGYIDHRTFFETVYKRLMQYQANHKTTQ